MTKPVIYWTPVIAPGNLIFYNGAMFPQWKGSALVSGLATKSLSRITFDGQGGAKPAERWDVGHRIRDVEVAPDGALWMLEDSRTGGVFRVTPKSSSEAPKSSVIVKPERCLVAQKIYSEAHGPIPNLPLSFRHRNRHCLAGAAFGDPDRVARGLDCGWCLESFLDYRDAGLIAIDSNHGNLAVAILSKE